MANDINKILIPNVTKLPHQKNVESGNKLGANQKSEFQDLLNNNVGAETPLHGGVSMSSHAVKRLQERQIDFDGNEYLKLKEAFTKLRAKGGKDSLVITDKAAYIVDVRNNKVVTAVDKMNMNENVFTKIDSTVFIN